MEREKFWLVWCVEKGTPTKRHESIASAITEAERLARQNPGFEFHVLEWIGACIKPNDVSWRGDPAVPF